MIMTPEPLQVDKIGPWEIGQYVYVDDHDGDVWRVERLYRYPEGEADPFAGLKLLSRIGGMPHGTTGTAVRLERMRALAGQHAPVVAPQLHPVEPQR